MKNIHLLPTEKPSKLLNNYTLKSFCLQKEKDGIFINDGKVSGADFWGLEKAFNNGFHPQNIYITSDEFIEEGDFGLNLSTKNIVQYDGIKGLDSYYKKIILTDNKDLIKDGVQEIDDEFLEWFVKNPSCDRIDFVLINDIEPWYKIRFPKEETKQETLEEAANHYAEGFEYKQPSEHGLFVNSFQGFISGAKWQQEQDKNKYSEEEVLDITKQAYSKGRSNYTIKAFNEWFEQFKKK
jgi:hypothetical protein